MRHKYGKYMRRKYGKYMRSKYACDDLREKSQLHLSGHSGHLLLTHRLLVLFLQLFQLRTEKLIRTDPTMTKPFGQIYSTFDQIFLSLTSFASSTRSCFNPTKTTLKVNMICAQFLVNFFFKVIQWKEIWVIDIPLHPLLPWHNLSARVQSHFQMSPCEEIKLLEGKGNMQQKLKLIELDLHPPTPPDPSEKKCQNWTGYHLFTKQKPMMMTSAPI